MSRVCDLFLLDRGGPMPDFMLCNSKMTFQMTMTPEKTNYFTQGADGVKRLRQGPDLASYRGLSVIHSRAFSMEDGQHPRDILRRRVRTAEYYRILPHKDNINREFELYNEERDTWFSMTFQDLLRYSLSPVSTHNPSRYGSTSLVNEGGEGGYHGMVMSTDEGRDPSAPTATSRLVYGADNSRKVHQAYQMTMQRKGGNEPSSSSSVIQSLDGRVDTRINPNNFVALGVELSNTDTKFLKGFQKAMGTLEFRSPVFLQQINFTCGPELVYAQSKNKWQVMVNPFDMGVKHIPPNEDVFPLWKPWVQSVQYIFPTPTPEKCVICFPRLTPRMTEDLFHNMQNIPLNHPFVPGEICEPGTVGWFTSFTFYQDVYKRYGLPMDYLKPIDNLDQQDDIPQMINMLLTATPNGNMSGDVDITSQILSSHGGRGSVNHPLHLLSSSHDEFNQRLVGSDSLLVNALSRSFLLTYETLQYLLGEYNVDGQLMLGIDYLVSRIDEATIKNTNFSDIITGLTQGLDSENRLVMTSKITPLLQECIEFCVQSLAPMHGDVSAVGFLCKHAVNSWPMGFSTHGHMLHPRHNMHQKVKDFTNELDSSFGVLNMEFIRRLVEIDGVTDAPDPLWDACISSDFKGRLTPKKSENPLKTWKDFWNNVKKRIFDDPVQDNPAITNIPKPSGSDGRFVMHLKFIPKFQTECEYLSADSMKRTELRKTINGRGVTAVSASNYLRGVSIDMNNYFKSVDTKIKAVPLRKNPRPEDIEIVIVRPNIEHNMLGIIMGLSGSELGYTLWGNTELSCYDDSMHGIWGMSYKYHERAIVFNEKNLIRLWDIAYDGYNGGKDDTHVDWLEEDHPVNGAKRFRDLTLDLGRNYRGPSMMVMAFVHDQEAVTVEGRPAFDTLFRRNWPSPIVFHDVHNPNRERAPANETLPLDYDNIQVTDVQEFRVFNNDLYAHSYGAYREMMPSFHELHKMRKSAGQCSSEAETQVDSLAFQGSMRIKQGGRVLQEIQGSGHHGVDYVGIASVRAGKGIKYTGQAPTFSHMV